MRALDFLSIFSFKFLLCICFCNFHLTEGEESGLSEEDYKASVATLHSISTTLEADCVLLRERTAGCGIAGQYLIRHRAEQEDFVEIR